ncbi:MAG TPA: hypothetical protein VL947_01520, partial [Cytophagales bacterium]|nr:hypothetical protein [Cytophagales bacterium]
MALLIFAPKIHAQEFYELMNDPTVPLEKVSEAADRFFKEHGTGKGSGYKPFKRWEYDQKLKRNSKGKVLTKKEIADILEQRKSKQSNLRVALPDQPVYTELGPFRVAPTATSNPTVGVGRVHHIEPDPSNNAILYTAGVGGIWKSINSGTSWSPMTDHLSYYAYAVTVHPTNSNIVLAGFDQAGVFKSIDGGLTWGKTNLTYGNPRKIIFDPSNSNVVLVASERGLFRSNNSGDTFTRILGNSVNDIDFKPTDPSIVYACGDDFFRSDDGGLSFSPITAGISTSGRSFLAVTPANPSYVYVLQAKGAQMGYVYRSANSGVSFTTRLTANSNDGSLYYMGEQAWHDMA